MNFCGIDGNLTSDVELSTAVNGTAKATFSIAHNYFWNKEKKVDYYKIIAWGDKAERVYKFAKKGTKVYVIGAMSNAIYEAKDGTRRTAFTINATEIEIMSTFKSNTEQKPLPKKQVSMLEEVDAEGELPF